MKQPFADLLISGRKTIELRSWNTRFRGEFLVHASHNPDRKACIAAGIDTGRLVNGAIIGRAFLYDVKEYKSREEFLADRDLHLAVDYTNPRYGFMVKSPVRLDRPIPAKGKLNFFEVDV
ncbi:MAG: ASCH domain-containing protein [Candidatus Marsarchaeota archaeon]|nr:ASCH domain-containing protein [Candidatus Marsarchaeota archaeon]MCL5111488.1 ASCH domain-containing protein [Candidatus Marsarchaeota archaeon]